jgi:hypothetical protein
LGKLATQELDETNDEHIRLKEQLKEAEDALK